MVYCKYELTWEKVNAMQGDYISETSKSLNKVRTLFRFIIEVIGVFCGLYLVFAEDLITRYIGIFLLGLLVLTILYKHLFKKHILKRKFEKCRRRIEGEWYVELWADDEAITVKNVNGGNEVERFLFSEVAEYGETENECYFVCKLNTYRFPKDSFVEGNWNDLLEKINNTKTVSSE